MTTPAGRARRGAALPAAIVALAVLGVLAAALAAETRTAAGAAAGVIAERRADDAVGVALHAALRDWGASGRDTIAVGRSATWSAATPGDVTLAARATRLDARTWALDARAEVRPARARLLARRAARLLVALDPLVAMPDAAVTLGAALDADAATVLDGRDTLPPGWACDAADTASVPALAHVADAARYRVPPAPVPPAFAAAARAASLAPLGTARLPLVHAAGDHRLVGRAGQGVLVVDGDLELAGGAEVWGVIVVRGRLRAHGPNRVVGALLAGGRPGAPHALRGLRVRWSSCVASLALRAAGTVRPVTTRPLTPGF